ncbi:MAG: Cell division protein FtsA [uncultured bacterium]|nr:MAG: Cell division protein FtsA [uncultured bacterium]
MIFGNPFENAFGLDIGDLSLKLVELSVHQKNDNITNYQIKNATSIPLPAGYIVNGEIQQPEMVRQKLLQLLSKGNRGKKITSPYVVADLPEPKTFLTSIEMDMASDQITKEDVLYQCQKNLPLDLNETYVDWQISPIKTAGETTRVLIGAVPKITADSYTYLLESANLQPIAFEIEPLAIARSLMTEIKTGAKAILDLGATRSAIIIYDASGVCFSTSIQFSGELINTALTQRLKIDYKNAEQMKIKNGLNYADDCPNYLKIVDELIIQLITDIQKIINYYQTHYLPANMINQIDLCGGLSEMPNLLPTLSRRLGINCSFGKAWQYVVFDKKTEVDKQIGLTMVSALGLAMRATINPYNE